MVSRLPRHIQLKLEQTLAQWHQWQCDPALTGAPGVVEVLAPGIGNFSVLVEAQQRFVVRIDGLNPTANGLNRQAEWRALADAHRSGIAPCPRYFNPELGSLVCDYLPPDEDRKAGMDDVATLLLAIHRLPARHHRLDLAERIPRYEKLLEHRVAPLAFDVTSCHNAVMALLREVERIPGRAVLCHNDLLRANRVYSGGRLWALDWEYCAMGSPLYDLAVVINGDAMTAADAESLVRNYLGRTPRSEERHALHLYGGIYRYLELLWYQALERPVLDGAALEKKFAALRDMLAAG
jgi:thiamine kinase-like enzyme